MPHTEQPQPDPFNHTDRIQPREIIRQRQCAKVDKALWTEHIARQKEAATDTKDRANMIGGGWSIRNE